MSERETLWSMVTGTWPRLLGWSVFAFFWGGAAGYAFASGTVEPLNLLGDWFAGMLAAPVLVAAYLAWRATKEQTEHARAEARDARESAQKTEELAIETFLAPWRPTMTRQGAAQGTRGGEWQFRFEMSGTISTSRRGTRTKLITAVLYPQMVNGNFVQGRWDIVVTVGPNASAPQRATYLVTTTVGEVLEFSWNWEPGLPVDLRWGFRPIEWPKPGSLRSCDRLLSCPPPEGDEVE